MSKSFETFMIPYLKFTDFDSKAEFSYGFYTSDELINENANTLNSSNLYEISLFRRLTSSGIFPREVRLLANARGVPAAESTVDLDLVNTNILYEDSAASFSTCGLTVADSAVSTTAYQLLRQNASIGSSITVSTPITPTLTRSIRNSEFNAGISVFNLKEDKTASADPLSGLSGLPVDITLSRLLTSDLIATSNRDYSNIFADELVALADNAAAVQSSAFASVQQRSIISQELDYIIDDSYLNHGYNFSEILHAGFLVEKQRVSRDVSTGEHQYELMSSKFYGTPGVLRQIDREVSMGFSYIYKIRSVYGVPVEVTESNVTEAGIDFIRNVKKTVFVASEGKVYRVDPSEMTPPPPPPDVVVTHQIYPRFGLATSWRMPSSTQYDVVGFLVFRRESLDQPFTQIATIDFDKTQSRERSVSKRYPCKNVIVSDFPILGFVDETASPDRDYIYAICSIDAHTNISGYSVQLKCRYVRASNTVVARSVSRSQAPIAFPNILIDEDIFTDLIKIQSAKSISIVANPDLRYLEDEGDISEALAANSQSREVTKYYRMNLIDLNDLSQNNFDFNISAASATFISVDASNKGTESIRDFIQFEQ
jgi:hypothetical protein